MSVYLPAESVVVASLPAVPPALTETIGIAVVPSGRVTVPEIRKPAGSRTFMPVREAVVIPTATGDDTLKFAGAVAFRQPCCRLVVRGGSNRRLYEPGSRKPIV